MVRALHARAPHRPRAVLTPPALRARYRQHKELSTDMLQCAAGRDELENHSLASAPPSTAPAPPNGHTFLRFSMSGAGSETTVGADEAEKMVLCKLKCCQQCTVEN